MPGSTGGPCSKRPPRRRPDWSPWPQPMSLAGGASATTSVVPRLRFGCRRHEPRAHLRDGGRRRARRWPARVVPREGARPRGGVRAAGIRRRSRSATSARSSRTRRSSSCCRRSRLTSARRSAFASCSTARTTWSTSRASPRSRSWPRCAGSSRRRSGSTRSCYSERFENGATIRAGELVAGRRDRQGDSDRRLRAAPHSPAGPARLVLGPDATRRDHLRHRVAPVRPVPLLHRLDDAARSSRRRCATCATRSIRRFRTSAT